MSAFDENVVADAVFDLLNASAAIDAIVDERIYANRVPPQETPVFPLIRYQKYADFIPSRTLRRGIASYKGSYMVTGVTQAGPRAARTLAKLIQEAMTLAVPAGFVDIFPARSIYDEEAEEGDGVVYIRAGAIYTIEVEA